MTFRLIVLLSLISFLSYSQSGYKFTVAETDSIAGRYGSRFDIKVFNNKENKHEMYFYYCVNIHQQEYDALTNTEKEIFDLNSGYRLIKCLYIETQDCGDDCSIIIVSEFFYHDGKLLSVKIQHSENMGYVLKRRAEYSFNFETDDADVAVPNPHILRWLQLKNRKILKQYKKHANKR